MIRGDIKIFTELGFCNVADGSRLLFFIQYATLFLNKFTSNLYIRSHLENGDGCHVIGSTSYCCKYCENLLLLIVTILLFFVVFYSFCQC